MNCARDILPPSPERSTVTVEVNASDVPAFNELLNEFFYGTRYKAIVDGREANREEQIGSLCHLFTLTQKHWKTGQTRVVARFLAGLYNGNRFAFDLTDLRLLDSEIFEHCLNVLRLDARPAQEVHCYFERGGELWEQMIQDYELEDRGNTKSLASDN